MRLLSLFAIILISQSCASVKHHDFRNTGTIAPSVEFQSLGTYRNKAANDNYSGNALWQSLKPFSTIDSLWYEQTVQLTLLSENRLKAILLFRDRVVDSTEIEVLITEYSLELKSTYHYAPGIVILAVLKSSASKLALLESGELIVLNQDAGIILIAGVLPVFGAAPVPTQSIYPRVTSSPN